MVYQVYFDYYVDLMVFQVNYYLIYLIYLDGADEFCRYGSGLVASDAGSECGSDCGSDCGLDCGFDIGLDGIDGSDEIN